MNISEGSKTLHAYITLQSNGQYGGVVQSLNPDRSVHEQLINGTWKLDGNQLTLNISNGETQVFTLQLSGTVLSFYENGQFVFSYRKIS